MAEIRGGTQLAQAGDGASPAPAVGTVTKLVGQVEVRHADGSQDVLKANDAIHQGDVIVTAGGGRVGITFDDGSVFSLGSGGKMTVDQLVYDPQAATGTEKLTVDQGAFSFTSGAISKSAPDAMAIHTPVMTIGVRGTTGAGVAGPEGKTNTVTLLKDPDGKVGEVAVKNQAGTQVMNAIGATTQVVSAFQAPPKPTIMSQQQIEQQYGSTLQTLPPPPTQQQLQQLQQQRQSQAPTDKAVQEAKAEAAEKAEAEKVAAEKSAEADKALESKLTAEKSVMVKTVDVITVEKTIGKMLVNIFGTEEKSVFTGPLGPGGGDEFGPLVATKDLNTLISQIGETIQAKIDQWVQQEVKDIFAIAATQPTVTHDVSGTQTVTLSDGVNDDIRGSTGNDTVSVTGNLGNGDSFWGGNGTDSLTVNNGANTFGILYVETVTMAAVTTGLQKIGVFTDGGTTFTLGAGGSYAITSDNSLNYQSTGSQTWTFNKLTADVSINMGENGTGDSDTIALNAAGTFTVGAVSNVEAITLANGTNDFTFGSETTGITLTGGSGADTVRLSGTGSSITVGAVETLVGSAGQDSVTLAAGGNVITVSAVESITGGSGTDQVTLGAAGTLSVVSGIESLTGSSGNDTFVISSATGLDSVGGGGGTDSLVGAASLATFDLSAATTIANVTITSNKTDGVTIKGNGGNNIISGNTGNDTLWGGGGADQLSGGAGSDTYYYAATGDLGDTIDAFVHGADKFAFLGSQFGSLGAGTLGAGNFVTGTGPAAADADDYFLFNTTNNTLYFDADGNGGGAATAVATIASVTGGSFDNTDIQIT